MSRISRARYNNSRKITWVAKYSDIYRNYSAENAVCICRESERRILSPHRISVCMPARAKRSRLTRVYGGADLSAEHCLPVKRSRNEATHRSGRLTPVSASSALSASERALAVELSYNSPDIMFKYYRVGHTAATILPCTRGILRIPRRFISSASAVTNLDFSLRSRSGYFWSHDFLSLIFISAIYFTIIRSFH